MHDIEPFFNWEHYYDATQDKRSPFYGQSYNPDLLSSTIYGYYISPFWDYIGSETLYLKVLYMHYKEGYAIIELFGEWNDALHNDIMHFKRNVLDHFSSQGINKYILVGENILNFHGSDDAYYEEWFEDVEEGWICALQFRDHVTHEWKRFGLHQYIFFGETLDRMDWRTYKPLLLCRWVDEQMRKFLP
jgi:hypothetical protein